MKKIAALLALAACGDHVVSVNTNADRIDALEQQQKLTQEVDALQAGLHEATALSLSALEARVSALEASDVNILSLLEAEEAARIQGDLDQATELAAQIALQNAANALLSGQIAAINVNLSAISSDVSTLQSLVSSNTGAISALQAQADALSGDLSALTLQLQADVSGLQAQIDALSNRVDSEGVKVYACQRPDASLSKERFFKVGGLYYGAMNYVTTGTASVVAGASPVTVSIPKLCQNISNPEQTKAPNGGGQCTPSNQWQVMPGTGVSQTVTQFTSTNITVVTSVQIALEALNPASTYTTTDNSPACTFTTGSLVEVQ